MTCPGEEGRRTRSYRGRGAGRRAGRKSGKRPRVASPTEGDPLDPFEVAPEPEEGQVLGYFITIPGRAPRYMLQ
jgi:hypothetical protein